MIWAIILIVAFLIVHQLNEEHKASFQWRHSQHTCPVCNNSFAGYDLVLHPGMTRMHVCKQCALSTQPCSLCGKLLNKANLLEYEAARYKSLLCRECCDKKSKEEADRRYQESVIIENTKALKTPGMYYHYRKTSHWRATRASAIERAGNRCEKCGSTRNLQVHHKHYLTLGEESDDDLIVLCRRHYAALHRGKNKH